MSESKTSTLLDIAKSSSDDLFDIIFDKEQIEISTDLSILIQDYGFFYIDGKRYIHIEFVERFDHLIQETAKKLKDKQLTLRLLDYDVAGNITADETINTIFKSVSIRTRSSSDIVKVFYIAECLS